LSFCSLSLLIAPIGFDRSLKKSGFFKSKVVVL
jgi:hypothetical protein